MEFTDCTYQQSIMHKPQMKVWSKLKTKENLPPPARCWTSWCGRRRSWRCSWPGIEPAASRGWRWLGKRRRRFGRCRPDTHGRSRPPLYGCRWTILLSFWSGSVNSSWLCGDKLCLKSAFLILIFWPIFFFFRKRRRIAYLWLLWLYQGPPDFVGWDLWSLTIDF